MQSIDATYASIANYDTTTEVSEEQYNAYYKLGSLFVRHQSAFCNTEYYMPKAWALPVLSAVKDMLSINHHIMFVDLREQNSKLILNFHYTGTYNPKIHERVREVKNYIDKLVHMKVSQFEVARKFHYATNQFF